MIGNSSISNEWTEMFYWVYQGIGGSKGFFAILAVSGLFVVAAFAIKVASMTASGEPHLSSVMGFLEFFGIMGVSASIMIGMFGTRPTIGIINEAVGSSEATKEVIELTLIDTIERQSLLVIPPVMITTHELILSDGEEIQYSSRDKSLHEGLLFTETKSVDVDKVTFDKTGETYYVYNEDIIKIENVK